MTLAEQDWRGEHLIRSPRRRFTPGERDAAASARDYEWFAKHGFDKFDAASLCGVKYETVATWASRNKSVRWQGERARWTQ